MRLHELAKEVGVSSKDLLALAREIGLNIKTHSSNIAAGEESILRIAIQMALEEQAEKEAAVRAQAEEEERQRRKDAGEEEEEVVSVAATSGDTAGDEIGVDETAGVEASVVVSEEAPDSEGVLAQAELSTAPAGEEPPVAKEASFGAAVAEPEAKPKPKIKKPPPRRPGATILGRIKLEPPADRSKSRETGRRDGAGRPGMREGVSTDPSGSPAPVKMPQDLGVVKEKVEEGKVEAQKIKRFIKPKQEPVFFDPEDDPMLQGLRIRHWNKHMRSRRPAWRPTPKAKKRLKKFDHIVNKKVAVVPPVALKDLSSLMGIKAQNILFGLMKRGIMAHINSMLDEEAVLQIAVDFNREIDILQEKDVEKNFMERIEKEESEGSGEKIGDFRPPIVAFLGHVDHGKTSLLDAIRKTNVAASEDGGITQHVSACKVEASTGHPVVFLDTPGHKAFTEMRARGANTTDIVVLVVAADDGVMPQTEEAIQHARAAGVPIVVAINKIDKANANAMRVKQQLAGVGVMTEDWGGDVGCVEVCATTGQGLDALLERLVLEAEIQELKCNPAQAARGYVFEARKDDEVGNVVTLLVRDGTINVRDYILAGESVGRVRALIDDRGRFVDEAEPSTPVNVIGFDTLPEAGARFMVVQDAAEAREIAEHRKVKRGAGQMAPDARPTITLENLFESIEAGKITEILVILKTDVKGTLEVLTRSLQELVHAEVKVKILREGLGDITEDDVLLAIASNAVILGFHVQLGGKARRIADENSVEIRLYKVIYQLLDDIRLAMEGTLAPLRKKKTTAHLEIREVFKFSRIGSIAGCFVLDGTIHRSDRVWIFRDKEKSFEGEMDSLKRFTDDQREVREGFECGVKIAGFDDIRKGDIIESYEIVEEKRTLDLEI